MMNSKERYRILCQKEESIPIFLMDWWLDAICGNSWGVSVVEANGEIVAALPFSVREKFGFKILEQPSLTQFLGPWIKSTGGKYHKKLSREKDLMHELIESLPAHDKYIQNWSCLHQNWLPFYWKGFEQTTKYTYRIEDTSNIDLVWDSLQSNIKTDIKKCSERMNVKIRKDLDIHSFWELNQKTFQRQAKVNPYSKDLLIKIDKILSEKNSREILIAEDDTGRHHAGVYIIWDKGTVYYLMGGGDPELRSSGATSLCMWEAIKSAGVQSKAFDFEGSMIEPIERFFRGFGAIQTPYFSISKNSSKLFKKMNLLKEIMR